MKAARRLLERYEGIAEAFEAAGELDDAIAAVQYGVTMAVARHPGVYTSVRMERLLARIGTTLPPFGPRPAEPTRRVLHVVTETYPTGGHTRMVWRWIDRDRANAHSLVSTTHEAEVPDGLAAAVRASGGHVYSMPGRFSHLERAQALREVAQDVDLIVVHSHAMDPLPVVAYAEAANRPPIVVFNHADHIFWLGASIADVLHCIRPVSLDFAVSRGIAAERCVLTTAPVSGGDGNGEPSADTPAERAAILDRLGWPQDATVLFTAGSAWKYLRPKGQTLLDLVEPVLREHPDVYLIAAGFDTHSAWATAAEATGGRVAVVGAVPELAPYFDAADVYLESRPIGGTGASCEAAAHGLPVLSHAVSTLEAGLYCTDDRYGTRTVIGASEYRRALRRLIAEPELRAEWGTAARAAIADADAQWDAGVERVTRLAATIGPASLDELRPVEQGTSPRDRLVESILRNMHLADPDVLAGIADDVERLTTSPGLRAAYGDIVAVASGPTRPYRAAVALAPPEDPEALRAVVAEFRLLQRLKAAEQFAIGLRPDQAEGAIPVLEDELEDESITVDVFIDERPEQLLGARTLELVPRGADGTGRAPVHAYDPQSAAEKSPR